MKEQIKKWRYSLRERRKARIAARAKEFAEGAFNVVRTDYYSCITFNGVQVSLPGDDSDDMIFRLHRLRKIFVDNELRKYGYDVPQE